MIGGFQVGAFQPNFQRVPVDVAVGGGVGRRRRRRKRLSEEFLIRQEIISARQEISRPVAMAVALSRLEIPAQSDVAISTTAEIARLIRRAQKQQEDELMMILSEMV